MSFNRKVFNVKMSSPTMKYVMDSPSAANGAPDSMPSVKFLMCSTMSVPLKIWASDWWPKPPTSAHRKLYKCWLMLSVQYYKNLCNCNTGCRTWLSVWKGTCFPPRAPMACGRFYQHSNFYATVSTDQIFWESSLLWPNICPRLPGRFLTPI